MNRPFRNFLKHLAMLPGPNGCWLWTGSLLRSGYGNFWVAGKFSKAHRYSFQVFREPIPPGLYVLHNCPGGDNKACVNPAHLWLGTHGENMHDAVRKGRTQKKLTPENIRKILALRAEGLSQRTIARQFNVARRAIRYVEERNGRTQH